MAGARCQACERTVPGLNHICSFLDSAQQAQLLALVELEGYFEVGNQVMIFGAADFPAWCTELARSFPVHLFPAEIRHRRPLWEQLAMNRYQPGEGLKAHTDLLRFQDGICIVSLGSSAVLCFSEPVSALVHKVFMAAGDLIMMHGPARYDWQHGIPSVAVDTLADGSQKARAERTSITFRAMDATAC